jgi:hypothetical protein
MKQILALILIIFCVSIFAPLTQAKILPQAQKATKVSKTANTNSIGVFPKLRKDRQALNINFSNLQNATAVSYLLTYQTSTQNEGAGGALNLTGGPTQSAELLFGTCSKNVCTYHKGIKNAKLEVTYTTKAGKKYIKRFRIKI